jgi:tRNA (mo5U34)-methyltransferase
MMATRQASSKAYAQKDEAKLRQEVIELGPWHLEVQITPELSTRAWLEAPPGTYPESYGSVEHLDYRDSFRALLAPLYPDGLEGRSVLDCACNCGGYLFWAKELGAGECFGFDIREHWINQGRFLVDHCDGPTDDMRFEVCDLYDLPSLELEPFDITLFNGIFYHLPDPITGLKIAADHTKGLLFLTTATRVEGSDGFLALENESTDFVMQGVYGLSWLPTGPQVLSRILKWCGFNETRIVWWTQKGSSNRGWAGMLASREEGLLKNAPSGWPPK